MTYVGTDDIAAITGLTRRYVTDVVVKQPWFPRPLVRLSQKTVRWDDEAVRLALSGNKVISPNRRRR